MQLIEYRESLEREGLIRDRGNRNCGQIVWERVPPSEFTGTWPRFDPQLKLELIEARESLERDGLVRDSGKRHGGQIVWQRVPPSEFTGKPWPRVDPPYTDRALPA